MTCTLSYTMSKTGDQLILRSFSQDSPGSVSTGETPRQKMSKAVAPRDTKQLSESILLPGIARHGRKTPRL
ncbi:hypothetical protein AUF78_04105 [archaeon 13_1_20CM_2_51_12]|nr:MAG: hypothetical protein AUF78_04105 [archaeon 13_1_20CM_2_51_12]